MAREPKYGTTLNGWERLVTSVETNAQDMPHLEAPRAKLAAMLAQARDLSAQQAASAATKQDASKRLRTVLKEGRKLATFVRSGVREHYGTQAEKLVEFDILPFRGVRRAPAEVKEPAPPTPPSAQ